jgi:hypothetical protein
MTHTWSRAIAVISQSSYDDSDTTRKISLVKYFFDFFFTCVESSTSLNRSFDHIDGHTCFFCIGYCFGKGIIFFRVGSSFGSKGYKFCMNSIDFRFDFCPSFFLSLDCRSSSHGRNIRNMMGRV